MLGLLLAACAEPPPAPPTWTPPVLPPGDPCAAYTDPDTLGFCLATSVRYLSPEEAAARCALAGSWEAECRYRFVAARLRDIAIPPPGALGTLAEDPKELTRADAWLSFCADDDCRFMVVDRFRDPDLVHQLERCGAAGRYVSDCAAHATESWRTLPPDRARTEALWAAIPRFPEHRTNRAAEAAGWAFACLGLPCPAGSAAAVQACEHGRGSAACGG